MKTNRQKRHLRIRKKISGTTEKPRLSVYRSNKHIEVQLINDEENKAILGMNTKSIEAKGLTKTAKASTLGKELAKKILEKSKGDKIVFDRGGYKYHGRVKALADALRENGIKF